MTGIRPIAGVMMAMRPYLMALVLVVALGGPVAAQSVQQSVEATLESQGYVIVEAHRTLLGRLRILADADGMRREIVLNPHTGEVLRDYAFALPTADPSLFTARDHDGEGGDDDAAVRAATVGESAAVSVGDSVVAPDGE